MKYFIGIDNGVTGSKFLDFVSPGAVIDYRFIGTGDGRLALLQDPAGVQRFVFEHNSARHLVLNGSPSNEAKSVVIGSTGLATNATEGFLYIPITNGIPTGTPTTYTGRVAMTYDTLNQNMYVFVAASGGWLMSKNFA